MLFQLFFSKKRLIYANFVCYLKNSTYFCTNFVVHYSTHTLKKQGRATVIKN